MLNYVGPRGLVTMEHIRNGQTVRLLRFPNGVTIEGKNDNLDAYFRNQVQPTNWYLGLIDNTGYTAVDEADTMSSHSGWTEFTAYDEATRPEWAPDAAASKSVTNTTQKTYTINSGGTIVGGFCCSESTKSGSGGVLWATALAASPLTVIAADVLKVTYTVSM